MIATLQDLIDAEAPTTTLSLFRRNSIPSVNIDTIEGYNGTIIYWLKRYADSTLIKDERGNIILYENEVTQRLRSYDSENRMTSQTKRGGVEHKYEYTACGKLARISTGPDGYEETFEYLPDGSVLRKNSRGYKERKTYDEAGNVIHLKDTFSEWTATYDDKGNELTCTFNDTGESYTKKYDAKGNLLSQDWEGRHLVEYTYDEVGNMVTSTQEGNEGKTRQYICKDNSFEILMNGKRELYFKFT